MAGVSARGRWAEDLVDRLRELEDPSREDLFVLLLTWLQAHTSAVTRALRVDGRQLPLVEPLDATDPQSVLRHLREAAATPGEVGIAAVAASRALDQELANTNAALLTGEHLGIGGDLFRVRPRIIPGGIDELYGAAKDDPTFGVARRMACVPVAPVGGVRLVDAGPLPPWTATRLARRREAGSLRVLVDAMVPDRALWVSDGPWTSVQRTHDHSMETLIADILGEAAESEADVVILPELAMDPTSLRHVQGALAARRARFPHLLVVGITHQRSAQVPLVVNEAVVLDGRGRELLRHRKLAPFSTADGPGGLTGERLDPGDAITVLSTPVGNIGVLICKDLFDDRPEPALRIGYVTWLLVPSLSRSTGPHRDCARQLRPRRITTIVCNAWDNEDERRSAGQHIAGGPTHKVSRVSARRSIIAVDV